MAIPETKPATESAEPPTSLTPESQPENRTGLAGGFYIVGNLAMLAGGAATGNMAALVGSVAGLSGCALLLLNKKLFKQPKHQVMAQRAAFALNAFAAGCFVVSGIGVLPDQAFDAGNTVLGLLGLVGNAAGALKKEPQGQTSLLTDLRHVRSPQQLCRWWQQLPPGKAATLFFLPSGLSPVAANLLAGVLPTLAQWVAAVAFTTGNLLVARSSLKSGTSTSAPHP